MSMQFILNNCVQFSLNYRKISTQMLSRSGRLYTNEYPSAQPFRLSVKMHDYMYYPEVRTVIQNLDNLDRINEEVINFASVDPQLTWLVRYQGALTAAQIAGITITSFSGNVFTMNLPAGVPPGTVIFAQGDYLQPANTRYAYKVNNQVVAPAAGTSINVAVHRPILGAVSAGTAIVVGVNISIPVVLTQNPFTQFNPMANGAYVAWSGTFDLIENITG